jgi:hypothetical protein
VDAGDDEFRLGRAPSLESAASVMIWGVWVLRMLCDPLLVSEAADEQPGNDFW